ncbi:MAG: TolC family protein [Gammaproteobacteria bacterium]|nr:TolC family protein [Gammaproteobacteria bacterium]
MFLFRVRALGACLLIAGLSLLRAHAEEREAIAAPVPSLSLSQAIERALAANPALQGFAFALKAQDARITQAGQRPATEASFELENALGSGEFSALDAAEATFSLSQVIELGDKRQFRSAVAQSGREVLSVERQAAQLDVLAEVTRRFIAVAAAQEQLTLNQAATALAKGTVDDVALRVRAAKSPEGELLRSRAAFSRAGIDEQRAMAQLNAARQKLAATWGSSRPDYGQVNADLYRFPALRDFESLATRLDANPDFLRFASEARLRDAELRLAGSLRKPDLALSGGVRRLEETNDQALVMGISVPLFPGRRAAPMIAEAEALRGLVDVERGAARIQARTQLYGLYEQLQQAVRETETLRRDVMPQLEEALKATRYAYERGRYGYLELIDAQRTFLEARAAAIASAATGQELLAEIERLTGEPLVETNALEQP